MVLDIKVYRVRRGGVDNYKKKKKKKGGRGESWTRALAPVIH